MWNYKQLINSKKLDDQMKNSKSNPRSPWPLLITIVLTVFVLTGYYGASQWLAAPPLPQLFAPVQDFTDVHQLKLWDSSQYAGAPMVSSQQGCLYLNVFDAAMYSFFRPLESYLADVPRIYILFNLLVFSIFVYIFLRRRHFSAALSAFLAPLVWLLPPFFLLFLSDQAFHLPALALLPVNLVVQEKVYREKSPPWFVIGVLVLAITLLRASLPVIYITFWMLTFFFILLTIWSRQNKHFFKQLLINGGLFISCILVALLLSSYLFLQVWDVLQQVQPIQHTASAGLGFVDWLIPHFSQHKVLGDLPTTPVYLGWVLVYLAGAIVVIKPNRYVWALLLMLLISLFFILTRHAPLLLMVVPFLLLGLAAFGLKAIFEQKQSILPQLRRYTVGFVLVLILVWAGLFLFRGSIADMWAAQSHATLEQQNHHFRSLIVDGLRALGFVLLAALALQIFSKQNRFWTVLPLLALLIGLDGYFASLQLITQARRSRYDAFPRTVISSRQERAFPIGKNVHLAGNILGQQSLCLKNYADVLRQTGFHQPDEAWMRNPFLAKYYRTVYRGAEAKEQPLPYQQVHPRRRALDNALLDMLNLKYLVSPLPILDPQFRPVNVDTPYVYENNSMLPKAYFADSIKSVPGFRAFFKNLQAESYPEITAFLTARNLPASLNADSARVDTVLFSKNAIDVTVKTREPALLVLSENFYPDGWRATLNNSALQIYQTNHILQSVLVPANTTGTIRFTFFPKTHEAGLWISITTFISLLIALASDFIRQLWALKRDR